MKGKEIDLAKTHFEIKGSKITRIHDIGGKTQVEMED